MGSLHCGDIIRYFQVMAILYSVYYPRMLFISSFLSYSSSFFIFSSVTLTKLPLCKRSGATLCNMRKITRHWRSLNQDRLLGDGNFTAKTNYVKFNSESFFLTQIAKNRDPRLQPWGLIANGSDTRSVHAPVDPVPCHGPHRTSLGWKVATHHARV